PPHGCSSVPTRRSSDLIAHRTVAEPVVAPIEIARKVGRCERTPEDAAVEAAFDQDVDLAVEEFRIFGAPPSPVFLDRPAVRIGEDRKSTRLNSSHVKIS